MPTPIKCIFQGGGAKLATLIAACEILEEMEDAGLIEVTAVAGTSAGSIAAYLYADNRPIRELRSRTALAGQKLVEEVSGKVGLYSLFKLAVFGTTIFRKDIVSDFVRDIICTSDADRPQLSGARIPIYVRTADITNGQKHTYKYDNTPVELALSNSCAIPFAFHSHKSDSHYVDGGVVSNLADVSIFPPDKSHTIAFSFERSAPNKYKANVFSYGLALASTAIDNSVEESISKIEAGGGQVCHLPNDFQTLEFSRAIKEGLSDHYISQTRATIREGINRALAQFGIAERRQTPAERISGLNQFSKGVSDRLKQLYPSSVTRSSIICIAHGLNSGDSSDVLIKDALISCLGESLFSFRVGITRTESFDLGRDVTCEITDKNGAKVAAIVEVVEFEEKGEAVWFAEFCLDAPAPKAVCPLRVRLATTHRGLMSALAKPGGTEWMRAQSHQFDEISIQDFVLCAPKSAGKLIMLDLLENSHRAFPKPNIEEMRNRWCVGRRMTADEVSEYQEQSLVLPAFQVIGWRALQVPSRSFCGALIERAG